MKKLLIVLLLCCVSTSCGTTTQIVSYHEVTTRDVELNQTSIRITPMVAELQVLSENKIQPYVEEFDIIATNETLPMIEDLKQMALYHATQINKADALIGATFEVETTSRNTFKITVIGWPVKYVNFRSLSKDDVWLDELYRNTNNNSDVTPESGNNLKEKKRLKLF